MTWKLPSHLEPYRDILEEKKKYPNGYTLDQIMNWISDDILKVNMKIRLDLLQRLYDANLLKEPPPPISIEETSKHFSENTIITEE